MGVACLSRVKCEFRSGDLLEGDFSEGIFYTLDGLLKVANSFWYEGG